MPRDRPGRCPLGPTAGLLLAAALVTAGCDPSPARRVTLVGTTSTRDAGLLDSLVAAFEATHPDVDVKPVAVGSGEALELGRRGDGDVLLVHSPEAERRFVRRGFGRERTPVMANRFVIVGPPADPAGVRGATDPAEAFRRIARARASFVSRGDDSGTHRKERAMWRAAGVEPSGEWYREVGRGMAETLLVADEWGAYTLSVSANYLLLRPRLELALLLEGAGPRLRNVYSVIPAARSPHPKAGAELARWLVSEAAAAVIARFGTGRVGEPLFRPLPP